MSYLDKELSKASFNPVEVSHFLYGGKAMFDQLKKWEGIFDADPLFDRINDSFLSREERMRVANQRGAKAFRVLKQHKDMLGAHSPMHGDGGMFVARLHNSHCALTDHFALFTNTIIMQSTPEQLREWLPKAISLQIIGTYAQTELGHGSNVRALETTATFDEATDSFILDMPTITAAKWWPGALGVVASHAVVYARLLVKGKDLGFHAFMVQIRGADHKALPGVEVGDIGPKLGGSTMDAGYLMLKQVRVPRFNMLAKFQQLSKDGTYTKVPAKLSKIAYVTMMKARVLITQGSAQSLAKAAVIALRYNAFRRQGFVNPKKGIEGGELAIIEHGIQQSQLFPQLAMAYAVHCGAKKLTGIVQSFEAAVKAAGKDIKKIDVSMLPEFHATSAGLKSFCTQWVLDGIEECRKCCGGQGYSQLSGLAHLVTDFTPAVTYEGDRFPMALQTARVLMGAIAGKVKKAGTFKYLGKRGNTWLKRADDVQHLVQVWETIARNAANAMGRRLYIATRMKGKKGNVAWNEAHSHLVAVAKAHSVCVLLSSFAENLSILPEKARVAVTRLCLLFGLTQLTNMPVSITQLTPKQARIVDVGVKRLLKALRPDIMALAEAWSFSDRSLASLIALRTDDIYQRIFDWARKSPLNQNGYSEKLGAETYDQFLNKKYLERGNVVASKL